MKTGCLVVDVGKNCALGTFAVDERGRESDFFAETKGRVVFTKDSEYAM